MVVHLKSRRSGRDLRNHPMLVAKKYFSAVYADGRKMEVSARRAGWTGEDGLLDYAPPEYAAHQSGKMFTSEFTAVAWAREQIAKGETFFGCVDITELQGLEPHQRCRFCICQGRKPVRSFVVTDAPEIEQEESIDHCLEEDD